MGTQYPSAVSELLDSLSDNYEELCLEIDRQVPEEKRIITPDEAIGCLAEAILEGKVRPVNHPRRIIDILQRMVKGELSYQTA